MESDRESHFLNQLKHDKGLNNVSKNQLTISAIQKMKPRPTKESPKPIFNYGRR